MKGQLRKGINRKDSNQAQVVRAFEQLGAVVIDVTGDSSIGFDLLVAWRGFLIPVEVKDGSKAWTFTPKEAQRRRQLEGVGVTILVVESADQARRLLVGENK